LLTAYFFLFLQTYNNPDFLSAFSIQIEIS